MTHGRLIIFTRYPMPGEAKTRLIPAIGALGDARLQRAMTQRVSETARQSAEQFDCDLEVRFTDGTAGQMRRWLGAGCRLTRQGPGDLGRRLWRAVSDSFADGAGRVIMIGTDCPDVTPVDTHNALEALADNDLVLGPAADGGYWLIGLSRPEDIFAGIDWGTDTALEQTLSLAERRGLSVHQLDVRTDIDTPDDLYHLDDALKPDRPYLSVIIPMLNEAENIEAAIRSAAGDGVEVIVVDGGSEDGSVAIAERAGAQVISSDPGRATQMNAGATIAGGEVLLFLHADTVLDPSYIDPVFDVLSDPRIVGGAFRFRCDDRTPAMRFIEHVVNCRSRWLGLPYGDQGIFVRREVFDAIGGYPEVAIGEDVRLVRRMRARGRARILPAPVVTSARRWRKLGVVTTTAINQIVLVGLLLGLPERWLARLYRGR